MLTLCGVCCYVVGYPISVSSRVRRKSCVKKGAELMVLKCALALCLLLMAAACSTVMPPAPKPPAQWREAARLVPAQLHFTLSDGAVLPARLWPAQGKERALMLALHGFNDSRDAWEVPAAQFAQQGITVIAPDQRGFGQAPGRSFWAGTPLMVADIRNIVAHLQHEHPTTPLYLAGESMGGAVLMVLMAQPDAPNVAGTVLLAPAVWNLGAVARAPLGVFSTLAPHALVPEHSVPVHVVASDNMAALIRLYYNPLTLHATRWEALQGLATLMRQAAHAAKNLHGPVFCAYGDKDQLVPPAAMAQAWQAMAQTQALTKARLDVIPGGHHLLLRDRNGALLMQDIVSWMFNPSHWLPSGGDSAAALWFASQQGQLDYGKQELPILLPARLESLVGP